MGETSVSTQRVRGPFFPRNRRVFRSYVSFTSPSSRRRVEKVLRKRRINIVVREIRFNMVVPYTQPDGLVLLSSGQSERITDRTYELCYKSGPFPE